MTETTGYTTRAKVLHWTIAVLVILLLAGGQTYADMADAEKKDILQIHSFIGLTILMLALYRLYWRRGHTPPVSPEAMNPTLKTLSRLSHYSMYGVLILLPFSGMFAASASPNEVMPLGLFNLTQLLGGPDKVAFELRHEVHEIMTGLMALLIAIHFSAALLHLTVFKDGVFQRMWRKKGSSTLT
jgi:cytochrome b561